VAEGYVSLFHLALHWKNAKAANDPFSKHQQQSSLQGEANQTNSWGMDTDVSGSNNKRPLYYHQPCSQIPDDTRQSQGWKQAGTKTNNKMHILDMCNRPNNRLWRVHLQVLKLRHRVIISWLKLAVSWIS